MTFFQLTVVLIAIVAAALAGCAASDSATQDGASRMGVAAQASVVAEEDIPADINRDSWARLPILAREDLDEDGQRAFDTIVNPGSRYASGLRGPLAMWVYSPTMAEHVFPASSYLRFDTEKDQRLTELAIISTAREVNSQYEWTSHEPAARRAGLQDEIIEIVKQRRSLEGLSGVPGLGDREATIIRFAREVVSREKLSSETFAKALELFGEKGVMNLAGLIGYYSFVNITLKTFDLQLAPGRERLLPLP